MLQLYYVNKGTVIFSPFNIVNMFPIYEKGIEIALYKAISIPFFIKHIVISFHNYSSRIVPFEKSTA